MPAHLRTGREKGGGGNVTGSNKWFTHKCVMNNPSDFLHLIYLLNEQSTTKHCSKITNNH